MTQSAQANTRDVSGIIVTLSFLSHLLALLLEPFYFFGNRLA